MENDSCGNQNLLDLDTRYFYQHFSPCLSGYYAFMLHLNNSKKEDLLK
jgi:hypothetical protein